MSAPDMEVIKEIPGYKVILKAVLKTQIQHMVEQLATHTDEESVILTASVSDGTLSHLGSDSGKGFLEDNEEVKSQFLGFCLKRHHKKQQQEAAEKEEKERERQRQLMQAAQAQVMPVPTQMGYGPGFRRNPRGPYPRPNMPRPPGMSPGGSMRSPSQRFEPYTIQRPQRNSTSSDPGQLSLPTTPIKQEPSEHSNDGSDTNLTKSPQVSGLDSKDDEKSNSSSASTIPNEQSEGTPAGEQGESEVDPNVSVKVEAITETEMELEITGVEPGRPVIPQNWDPNVSMGDMGMGYDPNSGATGMAGDMQQNYSQLGQYLFECNECGKRMTTKQNIQTHLRKHTGEKPFSCDICGKKVTTKAALMNHSRLHTGEKPFMCKKCGKCFSQKSNLRSHMVTHAQFN